MSDTKESMPAQPKTVEIEKPPAWAIALSEKVANGFASIETRLDTVETNVTILVDDKKTVNDRLSRIEQWKENEVNARLNANSERAKSVTENDSKQDAVIGSLVADVSTLKTDMADVKTKLAANNDATLAIKREVVDGVKSFWKRNPKLETALVGLLLAAAGAALSWVSHGGHLP